MIRDFKTRVSGGKTRCFIDGHEVTPAFYVAGYFEQNNAGPSDSNLNFMASSPSALVTAAANSSERHSSPQHFSPVVSHG